MSEARSLDVVNFPEPYNSTVAISRITENTLAMFRNELPGYQVNVGSDVHLAGTLAVRAVLEDVTNREFGESIQAKLGVPFRFVEQNLRLPDAVRAYHHNIGAIAPHHDICQIGPAVHGEWFGTPTRVQLRHMSLPEVDDRKHYEGPDLASVIGPVYEGETRQGTLTIFSQGFAEENIKPTAHYFARLPDQLLGGNHTRYFMSDTTAYATLPDFEAFANMRKAASQYYGMAQWLLLQEDIEYHKKDLPNDQYEELRARTSSHLDNHPAADFYAWNVRNPQAFTHGHGVFTPDYPPEKIANFLLPLEDK